MVDERTDEDVVALLTRQHGEIKAMFQTLTTAADDDRAEAFQGLVGLLAAHEAAEEEVLHPAARRAPGGDAVVDARLAEESAAKATLSALEDVGPHHLAFPSMVADFERSVIAHAEAEEQQEFPLIASTVGAGDRRRLASAVEKFWLPD